MLKIVSSRVWRLDEPPVLGGQFEIADRVFQIVDIDARTTKRTGRDYTMLTIEGRCCVCGRTYTYSCTKTQINPLQTCKTHRGKSRKRHLPR
jgi:hypothetical protein